MNLSVGLTWTATAVFTSPGPAAQSKMVLSLGWLYIENIEAIRLPRKAWECALFVGLLARRRQFILCDDRPALNQNPQSKTMGPGDQRRNVLLQAPEQGQPEAGSEGWGPNWIDREQTHSTNHNLV